LKIELNFLFIFLTYIITQNQKKLVLILIINSGVNAAPKSELLALFDTDW